MLGGVTDVGAWTELDAWVLICMPGRPRRLRGVLSAADHYNHAVPEQADLAASLARLAASGLVFAQGGRVAATAAGLDVLEQAQRRGRDLAPEVRALLSAIPRREGPALVSPSALEAAYRHYPDSWWRRVWRRYA